MANDIIKDVENITADRGYWFVRTDSGDNFDVFLEGGFIGIGWNEITVNDIVNVTPVAVKTKIARFNNYDLSIRGGKSHATAVYNKLVRFKALRKNDVIVMPSYGSAKFAFGIIEDEGIYQETKKLGECNYVKRRKVKWVKVESIGKLDNIFYKIKASMHAISSIKKYENYINNIINSLYVKDGYTHFVLEVTKGGDIDLNALSDLLASIQKVSNELTVYFGNQEKGEVLSVKLNLQSSGAVELKRKIGMSVLALAIIFSSCSNNVPIGEALEVKI